jgi:hypothetical protein
MRQVRQTPRVHRANTHEVAKLVGPGARLFVDLDIYKDLISVAVANSHCRDRPVFVGSIGSRQADIDKLVRFGGSKPRPRI